MALFADAFDGEGAALPASPSSFIPSVSYLYFGVDVFLHREVSCLSRPLPLLQRNIPTRSQLNQVIMTQLNERCKDIAAADGSVSRAAFKRTSLPAPGECDPSAISLGEERVHFAPAAVAAVVSACCKTIKVKIVRPSVDASVLFRAAATAAGTATDRVCYVELVAEVFLIKWD